MWSDCIGKCIAVEIHCAFFSERFSLSNMQCKHDICFILNDFSPQKVKVLLWPCFQPFYSNLFHSIKREKIALFLTKESKSFSFNNVNHILLSIESAPSPSQPTKYLACCIFLHCKRTFTMLRDAIASIALEYIYSNHNPPWQLNWKLFNKKGFTICGQNWC